MGGKRSEIEMGIPNGSEKRARRIVWSLLIVYWCVCVGKKESNKDSTGDGQDELSRKERKEDRR